MILNNKKGNYSETNICLLFCLNLWLQRSTVVKEQLDAKKAEWEQKTADAVAKAKQDGKDEATMTAKELADKHAKEREAELDKKSA